MIKHDKNFKIVLLVVLLFISPALWLLFGNLPTGFDDKMSWILVTSFIVTAYAIYVALDSGKKH